MSHSAEAWVIVLAAATAMLVLIQVAILGGILYLSVRGLREWRAVRARLQQDGVDAYQIVGRAYRLLEDADQAVHACLEVSASANTLIAKSTEILDGAEETVSSVRGFVRSKLARVYREVTEPVHELRAMAAGIRSVVGALTHGNGQ